MKEIKAQKGMYLTQKNLEKEEERIFATALMGADINTEDWTEVPESDKAKWEETYMPQMKEDKPQEESEVADEIF